MSIARRLYDIARARLSRSSFVHSFDGSNPFSGASDFFGGSSAKASSEPGAARESAQDPKLARCWANLELPYGAGPEEVEKAWKRLSRMYHPDRHVGDPEREQIAHELMQGINQAHETLRRHFRRSAAQG